MKTLVIVDVQRDFFDPAGSLYVRGGEQLPGKIAAKAEEYDSVICTLDFHPGDHSSFEEQGGPWPAHCVAYTQGAGLPDCFAAMLADGAMLHFKGCDAGREQYGAFGNWDAESCQECAVLEMSDRIDVCGIAGDYCVLHTVENLLRHIPESKVHVLEDLTVSIDGGETLHAFLAGRKQS